MNKKKNKTVVWKSDWLGRWFTGSNRGQTRVRLSKAEFEKQLKQGRWARNQAVQYYVSDDGYNND